MQKTIILWLLAGIGMLAVANMAEAQGYQPLPPAPVAPQAPVAPPAPIAPQAPMPPMPMPGAPYYLAGPPGAPPIVMPQAPMDPHQFCYFNGLPYSMGSPYPGNTPGANGRPLRCRASDAAVNGYLMMEWSDEN